MTERDDQLPETQTGTKFEQLKKIVAQLRDPENGCPWDIKQTHQSLKKHLLEETYELVDAINDAPEDLSEELGDLLLQVLLHSQIAQDRRAFNIEDVIASLSEKLIERHPHVFGSLDLADAEAVKKNWDKIKSQTKKTGRLAGVAKSAPALLTAEIIGTKVASVGFDWKKKSEVSAQVSAELEEFLEAKNITEQRDEFGDLLFSLAQYGRHLGISSEEALRQANAKFTSRFSKMEELNKEDLASLEEDPERLQALWRQAKIDTA